jgi:hypothetical protein
MVSCQLSLRKEKSQKLVWWKINNEMRNKICLIISIMFLGLLFQPKFHKPPVEFQSPTHRIIIEACFMLSVASTAIFALISINKKSFKIVPTIIGIAFLAFFLGLGIVFTCINGGNTYQDKKYYVNIITNDTIIYQYYGHGGLGSSSRLVTKKPLYTNINIIRYAKFTDGIWKVFDIKGKYLRSDTIQKIATPDN